MSVGERNGSKMRISKKALPFAPAVMSSLYADVERLAFALSFTHHSHGLGLLHL
jgi:hypothetical protein